MQRISQAQNRSTLFRMFFNDLHLFLVEGNRLVNNNIRNMNLANIMKETCHLQFLQLVFIQA